MLGEGLARRSAPLERLDLGGAPRCRLGGEFVFGGPRSQLVELELQLVALAIDCSRCAPRTVVRGPIRVLGTRDGPMGWTRQGPTVLRRSLLLDSLLLGSLG